MESSRPPSPRFLQRSRSGTPRLYHVSTPEIPPFSPNLGHPSSSARSKSAAKSRPDAAADGRRKPKENRENPTIRISPRKPPPSDAGANARKPRSGPVAPSAWALSPGRSPAAIISPDSGVPRRKRGGVGGFLGFLRQKKEPSAKEEAVHQLRMVTSRFVQWRFINARAEAAMEAAKSSAEMKLFYTWGRINELRNIVAAKRILIQRVKHKLKLARVLKPQIQLLNQWEQTGKRNVDSVAKLARVLGAACISLPLIDGAQANMVSVHRTICMGMDVMKGIEITIRTFYSKVEKVSSLLSELVITVKQETKGLEELMKITRRRDLLEMQEISLRANLIQAMKKTSAATCYRLRLLNSMDGVCINANQVLA